MQPKSPVVSASPRWRAQLVPSLLATVALTQFAAGAALLWLHAADDRAEPLRATSGVLLVVLSLLQLRLAHTAWQARYAYNQLASRRQRLFWQWISAGVVLSYGVGLLAGVERGGPHLCGLVASAWYTSALFLLVAPPGALQRILAGMASRPVRMAGWLTYSLVMLPLALELGLRAAALLGNDPLGLAYRVHPVNTAGSSAVDGVRGVAFGGRAANSQGYWDEDEFQPELRPGVLRVAAVGGALARVCAGNEGFLRRIERPDLEVYNFGRPETGAELLAEQVEREVSRYAPDLVLAFISVPDELTREAAQPGFFEMRWLHTYRLGSLWAPQFATRQAAARSAVLPQLSLTPIAATPIQTTPIQAPPVPVGAGSDQEYLRGLAGQLAVCRTPLDDRMRGRWRVLYRHLDRLAEVCRARGIQLALVVTPAEFQVNGALCNIVRRRAGYRVEDLDLTLPQRRLADYGRQKNLTVIDLLPHMTSSQQAPFERNQASLNVYGHAIAADVLAHWLRNRRGGLGEATALR